MKPIELPSLSHFLNKNGWLGSAGALRFQIETPVALREKDDRGNKIPLEQQELTAQVVLWQGPWSRPYAQEIGRETFPVTEAGRTALLEYLNSQAAQMEAQSVFTQQEVYDFYLQRKKAEQEGQQT